MDVIYVMELFPTAIAGLAAGVAGGAIAVAFARALLAQRELTFYLKKSQIALFVVCCAAFGCVIALRTDTWLQVAYSCLMMIGAGTLVITDILHRRIPNEIVLALIVIKLAFGIPALLGVEGLPAFNIADSCIGLLVCLIIFSLPAAMKKSVGAGDVKLAAAVGFCLGLQGSLFAVALMGAFVLAYVCFQRQLPIMQMIKEMVPMGPFLGTAMLVVLVAGPLPTLL